MTSVARAVLLAVTTAVLLAGCGGDDTTGPEPAPPAASSRAASPTAASTSAASSAAAAQPARACPDLPRALPVEGGLPALTLPCLGTGPDVRLSDLRGTPTVLNVWAAWCINCDREMPLFARAVRDYGDAVRFVGVHYKASRDAGLASEDDFGVPFWSVHDEDGDRVVRALRAGAPPQTLFVDAAGRLVGRKVGEIRSQAELRDLVERYLGVAS